MRRNAFSSLSDQAEDSSGTSGNIAPQLEEINRSSRPSSPLDFIPNAAPKKKRSRTWEKSHQDQVVTYRGISPQVREGLISLANSLNVSVDEVARAFLEYGVAQYQSGEICLSPFPKAQRMTLFPADGKHREAEIQGWLKGEFRRERKPGKKKKGNEPKLWEQRVSFRIPSEVKEHVREIAERHTVPLGEVVLFFFNTALSAYQAGSLILSPQPKNTGNTLF